MAETTETAVEEPVAEETEEIAEKTEIPAEGDKTEDADPNPEYSLEEIYQFVKKRMAEDACADETKDEASEEEVSEKEEEEEEVVTDHAPLIPVTMNQKPAEHGSLRDLLAKY